MSRIKLVSSKVAKRKRCEALCKAKVSGEKMGVMPSCVSSTVRQLVDGSRRTVHKLSRMLLILFHSRLLLQTEPWGSATEFKHWRLDAASLRSLEGDQGDSWLDMMSVTRWSILQRQQF
eukprot:4854077-Amphidinium_carterae.1